MQERRKDYIDVSERLARVEERQINNGNILGGIKNDIAKVDEKVALQNGRVRKLEDWNNKTIGVLIAAMALGNFLSTVLVKVFFK